MLEGTRASGGRGGATRDALEEAVPAGVPRPLGLLDQPQLLDAHRDAAGHVRSLRHDGRDLTLLSGPERIESGVQPLDLPLVKNLSFERPDPARFPCLALAYDALPAAKRL